MIDERKRLEARIAQRRFMLANDKNLTGLGRIIQQTELANDQHALQKLGPRVRVNAPGSLGWS